MKIGVIGEGAIGRYVIDQLSIDGRAPLISLVRPARMDRANDKVSVRVASVGDLPDDIDLMVDCAGHAALIEHGAAILKRGIDLVTVSLGALADENLEQLLTQAARTGGAQLHLASGAIGALDCLQAARVGGLSEVTYTGRKPPAGWRGSAAQERVDLDALTFATAHFRGTARQAATQYPKNANVAAAVALAGLGFDHTQAVLIADPDATANIHEIHASGAFGSFGFRIEGKALPDNPRSSALAAMSVISAIHRRRAPITT
ncbi:aspartate dehydrogenase [Roseobacter litoralis]|uniref:L-aspartate dehydrogenase n=1 Tax=Roseobacter litoralis (strain ATCC 49566 / DSM 6996 / JCM 21268 / NBRC 15278 / OCh 149) TaxID=391595 RepID=F7ZLI8_ROSLO|nr:aspartate dehydrogenase [Roseobacter litoralis]AEI92848.1 putative aspartate dehydrogenase [Roseobacter litoralis Och 149]